MEYFRLEEENSGHGYRDVDGNPCFSNINETGIPGLRQYCQDITTPVNRRAALASLTSLKSLAKSVSTTLTDVAKDVEREQEAVRAKWESMARKNQRGTLELTTRATFGFGARLRKVCIDRW